MSDAKILIVEDEGIEAMDIQHRLITLGYQTPEIAFSGEEAVKRVKEMRPDLVLMDIMLPGKLDGVMAAEKIRTDFDIPIIYLTAYADEDTLQRAKISEPYGYIVKPFKERELHITIDMALYKHQMERKLRKHEKWLDTTLKSIGDAVIATDRHGLITFMNPVAEDLTGWKLADAARRELAEVFNIINRESRQPVENPVTRVILEGAVVSLANHTKLLARDGREIPIDDSAAPIKDDKGKLIGVVLVFRDITERETALEEIHRSRNELEIRVEERTAELARAKELLEKDIAERQAIENRMKATNALLGLFTQRNFRKTYLDAVVDLLRSWSQCRCVGIRVLDERGAIPYESYLGFSQDFWASENCLFIDRDQCICIRVIRGEPDPSDVPMMTLGGAFCCNHTIEFVEKLSEKQKQRYRAVCMKNGFLSVSVIPIHYNEKILGAIHLADEHENKFTPEILEFIESVVPLIGEAVNRFTLKEQLRASENRLRHLSSQLLVAQEKERKRLASDLHDSLAASLSAIKFQIDWVAKQMNQGLTEPQILENVRGRVQDAIKETRRIMADLRPSVLDDLGIVPAISWFCREFQKTYHHINIETEIGVDEKDLPESLKTVIFRISQEALNNVAKHSQADLVNLCLRKTDRVLELIVQDNGLGFPDTIRQDEPGKGIGLVSMRERAELSGGSFVIESAKGSGTTLRASWPCHKD